MKRFGFALSLAAITLFGAAAPAFAATTPLTWIELQPSGAPPSPRTDASAVYIARGNQMILFGGNPSGCTADPSMNDTWVLSNANGLTGKAAWSQITVAGQMPPARRGHSAVYSPARDRMIVFGGDALGCSTNKFNDVWVLDHASGATGSPAWIALNPTGPVPSARSEHVAFYDQATNRMFVYGGDGASVAGLSDIWVLQHADGTGGTPAWEDLTLKGGPLAAGYTAGTYDAVTNKLTLFGGGTCCAGPYSNKAWTLSYANGMGGTPRWAKMAPTGTLPSARAGARGYYDAAANTAIYFGGNATNQVWQLSNANGSGTPKWTKLAPVGTAPAGRGGIAANPAAAYDSASHREIIFGGEGKTKMFNDTWILAPGEPGTGGPIYVLDTDNHRVQAFDANGVFKSILLTGFDLPTGLAMDPSGNVWVKDGNNGCSATGYDPTGSYIAGFGTCSPGYLGQGIFDNTGGIAADPSGNIWVSSPDFYYVQKFDKTGNFLAMYCFANVNVYGCPVVTPFEVQPMGMAFDASGNIYLANFYPLTGGFNIVKLSNAGVYLSTFGSSGAGNGQFRSPWGIAIDASGNVYVTDSANSRVQKFNGNGVYVSQFGSLGSGNGQFSAPTGIAIDGAGNIYVTDVGNNRVQKFDSNGAYLSEFGSYGSGNGQFYAPYGVGLGK